MGVWAPRPAATAGGGPATGLDPSPVAAQHDAARLGGSLLATMVLLVVVLLGCAKKKDRRRDSAMSVQDDGTIIVRGAVDLAPHLWKLNRVFGHEVVDEPKMPREIPRFQLKFTNELTSDPGTDRGSPEVQIYEGWFDSVDEPIATTIKTVPLTDDELVDELLFEAVVTRQFKHDNVIEMLGVSTVSDPYSLVFKHCPQGSLLEVLKGRGAMEVTYQEKVDFSIGVAKGMEHIAELGYIHRDLACRTVLVDSRNQPVIVDFGPVRMSRVLLSGRKRSARDYRSISPVHPDHVIAVAWSAPEVITSQQFSQMSDAFSFGVTMFEIFLSGAPPFGSKDMATIEADIIAGKPPGKPANCPTMVYSYMKRCLKFDPDDRPTFKVIVRDLVDVSAKHKRKAASSQWISSVTGIPLNDPSRLSTGSRAQGSLPTPPPPSKARRSSVEFDAELVPEQWMAVAAGQNPLNAVRLSAKLRDARGSGHSNSRGSTGSRPGTRLEPPSLHSGSTPSPGSTGSARSSAHDSRGSATRDPGYLKKSEMPDREGSASAALYTATNDPLYVDPIVPVQPTQQIELQRSDFEVNWDNRRIRESGDSANNLIRTNETNYGNLATARLETARGRVDVDDGEEYTMVLLDPATVTAQAQHDAAEHPMSVSDAETFQDLVRDMAQPSDARNFVCPFTGKAFFNADELAAHLRARAGAGEPGEQSHPASPKQSQQLSPSASIRLASDPGPGSVAPAPPAPPGGDSIDEDALYGFVSDVCEESAYMQLQGSVQTPSPPPPDQQGDADPAPAPQPPSPPVLQLPLAAHRPTIDLTSDVMDEGDPNADYLC